MFEAGATNVFSSSKSRLLNGFYFSNEELWALDVVSSSSSTTSNGLILENYHGSGDIEGPCLDPETVVLWFSNFICNSLLLKIDVFKWYLNFAVRAESISTSHTKPICLPTTGSLSSMS